MEAILKLAKKLGYETFQKNSLEQYNWFFELNLIQQWLSEKKNIHVIVDVSSNFEPENYKDTHDKQMEYNDKFLYEKTYVYTMYPFMFNENDGYQSSKLDFETYEFALQNGILEALEKTVDLL